MTEDKIVGWHHQLNEHGFGWTPGVGETSDSERLGGPCPSDAQSSTAAGSAVWTLLHLPCLSL